MTEHLRDPVADCIGKDKHATRAAAAEIANRMARRGRGRVSEYKCAHCGFYHVGESNGFKRNKNGKRKY
jgi:hypothetical protein